MDGTFGICIVLRFDSEFSNIHLGVLIWFFSTLDIIVVSSIIFLAFIVGLLLIYFIL